MQITMQPHFVFLETKLDTLADLRGSKLLQSTFMSTINRVSLMCSDSKPYAVVANRDILTIIEARNLLDEAGYLVLEAAGFDNAKTLLDLHSIVIELLFIDHRMPFEKLNGFDLIRYSTHELPHIEVLATSAANEAHPNDIADEVKFTDGPLTASLVKELLPKAASKT